MAAEPAVAAVKDDWEVSRHATGRACAIVQRKSWAQQDRAAIAMLPQTGCRGIPFQTESV